MNYSEPPTPTAAWGLDGICVVNVKTFTERRAHIERELKRFGLTGEFIFEHDANEITPELDAHYYLPNPNLTNGHKSCGLKHIAIMQRVVARNWDYCLVLEDDAILDKNFRQGVENALRELKQNYAGKACVTFIGSGGNWYTPRSQRKKGQHLYPAKKGRFTDSYIIGKEAAQQRLDWIAQHKMGNAIDNAFDQMDRELGIQLLWLEPTVVEQGTKRGLFGSTLEGRWPAPVQAFLHGWEKFRRKYIYQLWR